MHAIATTIKPAKVFSFHQTVAKKEPLRAPGGIRKDSKRCQQTQLTAVGT